MLNMLYPVDEKDLSDEEKNKAMSSLMFLTEKRDGTIKLMNWIDLGMTVSLTVSIDAIFITAAIEACEKQDLAVVD